MSMLDDCESKERQGEADRVVVEHSSGPSGGPRYEGGRPKATAIPDISHVEYEGFEQDGEDNDQQTQDVVTTVSVTALGDLKS
jgi:hypothetical protein